MCYKEWSKKRTEKELLEDSKSVGVGEWEKIVGVGGWLNKGEWSDVQVGEYFLRIQQDMIPLSRVCVAGSATLSLVHLIWIWSFEGYKPMIWVYVCDL